MGDLALHKGEYEVAGRLLSEGLVIHHEMKILQELDMNLKMTSSLMLALNRVDRATTILGAYAALNEVMQSPLAPIEVPDYEQLVAETHRCLAADRWEAAWAYGYALSKDLDALVAYALA
jgi:hypothetical protein